MLLGIWDNIEDLEEKLNISELTLVLDASRKQRYETNKFMAAIQGIDLDKHSQNEVEERFNAVEERANLRLYGEKAVAVDSMDFFGIDLEFDED